MKKRFSKLMILSLMFSLLAGSAYAADPPSMEWHKGYGTSYGNHVHEGFQTSDGGYLGIGQTWDSSDKPEMLVVKTDSSGNKEWQKIVGTSSQPDIGICGVEVSDGYICGGGLYSDGNTKPGLVKLDKSTGDIASGWPKYYSGSQNCCIRGIDILGDGSIVATGYVNSPQSGFMFICDDGTGFIMKTDSSGNQIWNKTLSVPQGTKVREISGGFAVASCAWFSDTTDHMDGVLIKTDSSGNETNLYRYGGTDTGDLLYDFDLTSDGGYILGGHTVSYGCVNWDYWLVKVNSSFVEEWHKTFGQPRGYDPQYIHDEAYGVRQTPDGGYMIAGGSGDEYSYSDCSHPAGCSDEWKAYLVKTDSSGNMEWEGIYPNEADVGNTASEYVGLTSDGGYISFNDTDAFWDTVGSNAFGFMKIASDGGADTDPPTPDPMTWASVPAADSDTAISMTATTASDPSGVEYYFDETSGNTGGTDSGWQDSTSYTDTGLNASTQYCYQVKARDKSANQNETGYSTTECATTTTPDTDPPTPDPMTWATVPYATGDSSIAMEATTASDPSGVEYYFSCISGGGHDSGWQDNTSYEDTGLQPETQYTYTTKARDKSSNQNQTAESTAESATTQSSGGTWTKVDDRDSAASYSGGWNQTNPSTAYMNTATFTASTGETAIYSFTGTKVRFYVWQYDTPQGLDVYIDNTFQETVNIDAGSEASIQAWESGTLTDTSHELKLEVVSGEPHIDAFEYYSGGTSDTDPPTPDPMTWASVPSADGESSISMTATTASDPSGVEYYFDETSGNPGGTDSGWQDSTSYTDSGLNSGTQYCYQVKARDKSTNQNETAYSTTECATTTTPDTTPPSPDPMTWNTYPYSTGSSSIAMVATTASDPSGVEYYFDETSGNPGGSDSGWQDSTSYEDTGLDSNTQYTYQVKARDKSTNQNETGFSSSQSATTDQETNDCHVESIVCDVIKGDKGNRYGTVTVTIYDQSSNPVTGADVTGTFTGDFNETLTETTDGNGQAVLTTTNQTKNPSYTFCVDDVVDGTLPYDSNDNVETCDSY